MTITVPNPTRTDISSVAEPFELAIGADALDSGPALPLSPGVLEADSQLLEADCRNDPDPVVAAVQLQARAVPHGGRQADPQAWIFAERARYIREGVCDPYAQLMLLRAGLLPQR